MSAVLAASAATTPVAKRGAPFRVMPGFRLSLGFTIFYLTLIVLIPLSAVALKAASDLGLNPITLEMGMNAPNVADVIDRSYKIADELKITGTPTYIIGDEIIPGAVGIDQLRARIANMRACGSTDCPATPG